MSPAPARGKRCPGCGRVAPPEASLCPMCFRRLDDVEVTAIEANAGWPARVRARAEAAVDAALRHPRISIAVAMVIVLIGYGYLRYFRPPSPLPTASTTLAARAGGDAWPGPDGGTDGARASDASPPITGSVAWAETLPAPAVTAPVIAGDTILIGLQGPRLVAFDATDGSERWSMPVAGEIDSAPVIADGTVYFAHRSGRVVALDAATGTERWAVNALSPVFASPAVIDGTVYVASFDTLVGIDAATGEVLWRRALNAGFIQIAPAVAGDHLLVATNKDVRFIDRRTGVEHYRFALGDAVHVAGGAATAYAQAPRTLYVFDSDTQTPWWWGIRGAWANLYVLGLAPKVPAPPRRWDAPTPRGAYSPVLAGDVIYVAAPDGSVAALDATTGAERWHVQVGAITVAPVLTGSGLLVATSDGLVLLDPDGGAVREQRPLDLGVVSGLAVTDAAIVLQTGAERDGLAVIR